MKSVAILLLGSIMPVFLWAQMNTPGGGQPDFDANPEVRLERRTSEIVLDGVLDEAAWNTGQPAANFWEYFPTDSSYNQAQTEVYMTYDDDFLYVAAKCYSFGEDYVINSLRRDYRAGGNDNISFLFDPFNDYTNAFVFGMNPVGVRREALIANGGNRGSDFDESWDNRWKGVSKIHDGYWTCELAIPFSTLRYKQGNTTWNFNCYRFDTQSNSRSTWQRIPQNQIIMNLAFMGKMQWAEAPPAQKTPVTLIPYLAGGMTKDFEADSPRDFDFDIGGDAKIGVSSGLNLDLTVNPDFSQVEVDQQVVNLDRFELFFPERRQFFLENADLFASFGTSRINPFFSRRIGITSDTLTGDRIPNTIYGGARLSGKLDNNWRIGLLSMQTADDNRNGLPSFNYSVAAVQRKLFSRSNLGLIFVNKQNLGDNEPYEDNHNAYNRVAGLEYNLASADNVWNGKAFLQRSFTENEDSGQTMASGGFLSRRVRTWQASVGYQYVGEDFDAQVGFVPRTNFHMIDPQVQMFFYPKKGIINRHGPRLNGEALWTPGEGRTDHRVRLGWEAQLRNTARLDVRFLNEYIYLLDGFDPTRTGADTLAGQKGYSFNNIAIEYTSDRRRKFSFSVKPRLGEFFNGHRYGVETNLTYRYQPYGSIRLNANYNYIDLPTTTADLFVIGPRIDLTFTKSVFLTVFLQYNNQIDNFNVNARFQWRFAPVSDFFLVYTDNYDTLDFGAKNRAIVGKVTYWLNL